MPTDWTQPQIERLLEALERAATREMVIPLPGGQGSLGLYGGDYTRGVSDSGGTLNRLASTAISASSLVNTTLVRVTDVDPSVVVTLATARAQFEGLLTIIKDETSNAGAFPIQIVGQGGETFDGEPDAWISTDRGYLVLYADGTNWRIIWTDTMGDEAIGPDAIGPFHLQETGVVAGTYGSATAIPVLTIDEDGRVEDASTSPVKPYETGAWIPHIKATGLVGAVRARGDTIGSAASAATERNNADCHDLFVMLWDNMTDAIATVSSGRGASAQADWDANKTIRVPNTRGRAAFGMNAGTGILTSAMWGSDPDVNGSNGGAGEVTLTQAQLAAHDHTATVLKSTATAAHNHVGATFGGYPDNYATTAETTVAEAGGGQPHNNVPPGFLVTWWLGL